MTKVQSKNAILFDIENDAGPLRDAMVATIGEGTALDQGLISAIDKAKLDGIAAGSTANATDAALRDRATHTGEQAIGTITGLVDALSGKATPADVAAALAGLVDSSPETLDTLNELAAALGDDPNFATTVSTALGNRLRVDAAQGLSEPQQAQGRDNLGLGSAALAASGDFATAAQGAKADTAVQVGDAALPAVVDGRMLVDEDGERKPMARPEVRAWLDAVVIVETRTALKALNPLLDTNAYLTEEGRQGAFVWSASNHAAEVDADPQEGVYVKADAVAATAGAWVRQYNGDIQASWFGAFGAGGKKAALQASIEASKNVGPMMIDAPVEVDGNLILGANSILRGHTAAMMSFTAYSDTTAGSLIRTTQPSSSSLASKKSNILIENLRGDGSQYPGQGRFTLVSGTTNTVKLPETAPAIDDIYNGRILLFMSGVNAGEIVGIGDYDGASRTATLNSTITAPAPGDDVDIGWNDNFIGLVGGLNNIHVVGCHFSNLPQTLMVSSSGGGKGVNFESGVTNGSVDRCTFENLFTAMFCQGLDGNLGAPNLSKRRAVGIRFRNSYASNCGSLLTVAGLNANQAPDGDADDSMIIASDLTYENIGHAPWRVVKADQQKSGVINLLEAQNVSIFNVRGRNDSTYPNSSPGYPTDYSARVGYGLSGNIGAMLWGHARHLRINGFVHHGNVDAMIQVQRGRALGDDAAGQSGQPRNCYGWYISGMECHGTAGYVIAIDPTLARRVPAAELTGRIEVVVGALSSGICDPNMSSFENIIIDVTERSTNKRIVGTPKQIIAAGNTIASFSQQTTVFSQTFAVTMANDTVYECSPPTPSGFVKWCIAPGGPGGANFSGRIYYNLTTSAICEDAGTPAGVSLGTTALTDGSGDGVAGNMNVAVVLATGKIQWKNRRGSSRPIQISFET
ncbi:MAG: hypothetical protein H5U11_04260 [Rhizobium sp.]|nr:hypothetical protein [Rhizobium sp.]